MAKIGKEGMSRGAAVLLIVVNLAVLAYSAWIFMHKEGAIRFPFRLYLLKCPPAVPIALFIVAALSGSVFLLNLSFPFLVLYGPVYFFKVKDFSFLLATQLSQVLTVVDACYIMAANVKIKSWKELFWGLLLGVILLLGYHKLQFGIEVSLTLPVLKVYKGLVDQIEEIF